MGRRSLLQLFGAGAVIIPAVEPSVSAKIIEPPKVELVEASALQKIERNTRHIRDLSFMIGDLEVNVSLKNTKTGETVPVRINHFNIEARTEVVYTTFDPFRTMPGMKHLTFDMSGDILNDGPLTSRR